MKQQGSNPNVRLEHWQMTYTFSCPAPCSRVIRVEAHDDEDAVGKIIRAGAMICRNSGSHDPCDTTHLVMTPLPERQLREVVRLSMQAEEHPAMASRD
jgi:hypothetical protein